MSVNAFPLEQNERVHLERVIARFSEASDSLQQKFDMLRAESEDLKRRLKEKDEEITRSARLATLGQMAAALAHEIRNPLGSLQLFLSLLQEDLKETPSAQSLLEGMTKSIIALDGVVSNMLQFSREPKVELAPVNLNSTIQEVLTTMLPRPQTGLEVKLQLEANPYFYGHEQSIRQVLTNAILNALQAMRHKGTLSISTVDRNQQEFEVLIEDTGSGVSAELGSRVFEPFVTSKNEGTGLGLAVVKQIVDQHQGFVSLESRPVPIGGAVFRLILPRYCKQTTNSKVRET